MRQRILSYDSTFGTERTDAITLHNNGVAASIPSQQAVPTFDDTKDWWFDCDAARVHRLAPGPLPAGLDGCQRAEDRHDDHRQRCHHERPPQHHGGAQVTAQHD